MKKQMSVFERYLDAMQKTGDIVLTWQYQKAMFKQSLLDKAEREALKAEIISDILSNVSATVDITEAVVEIDELKRAIDCLGN